MMKKILITGATGFVGNYVVNELLRLSCTIIATSAHEEKAREFSWYTKVNYLPLDLSDFEEEDDFFEYFDKPDLMIHLAWEGLPNYKSLFHIDENMPRHFSFLSNLIKNGLKDLTVIGTCLEYGMKEGCLNEDMPAEPAIAYAIAKELLRRKLEEIKRERGFSLKWARLFYMYGNGQNPNSLLSQLDRAIARGDKTFNMSGGEQARDYLPVEKVAEYIVRIALQNEITGIINCSSNEPITIKQFVKDYLWKVNKDISLNLGYYPYPDYEPIHFWGDNGKLKTILNNE